jgi:hypothetical protein
MGSTSMKNGREMHAKWDRARESEVVERWLAETVGEYGG